MPATSKKKIWTKPTMSTIGRIGDVKGLAPPAVNQNNGGSACTVGSPSCAFS